MLSAATSSSLALLTRRLSQCTIVSTATKRFGATTPVRTFATKKKKRLKREKRLRAPKVETKAPVKVDDQHLDWVDFQKSISISGFETGQTTHVRSDYGKRTRGGVKWREQMEKKEALLKPEQVDEITLPKNGQFPALRYSPEETQRLLDEAYAGLPEREGKRGTRKLRRERRRLFLVRKIKKISKKNYGIRTHERRMQKRSRIAKEVKEAKREAPTIRDRDAAYQSHVLERWNEIMFGTVKQV